METVLEASGLQKKFGNVVAVDNLSFSIKRGEVVGLLGPNGAGKTTTLQMLLGLLTPSAGRIRMFDRDFSSHREEALQRVNFSSTYVQLPLSLTPRENLMVFGRLYRVKALKERVAELLKLFDLLTLADRPTRGLSSGQLTRLHLAKSFLNRPELLFLDEPTASLDPDTADRMRQTLQAAKRETGLAMLYTSHNMREMEAMCDRIIFLYQGKLLLAGTPDELLREKGVEDLEALFLAIARQSPQEAP